MNVTDRVRAMFNRSIIVILNVSPPPLGGR